MRIVYVAALGLLLQAASIMAGEVTAAGLAPVLENNVVAARKTALEEAKRAAVEQALGSYIESRTSVSDFALASDTIYASVKGRIERYRVTSDELLADDIYRVEIVATFDDGDLLTDTERLLKQHHWHKKPRLLIAVAGSGDPAGGQVAGQLRQLLEQQFRKQGFEVFEERDGNIKRAGFLLTAEAYVNVGETSYQDMPISTNELTVNAALKRVGSGQIIASAAYAGRKPGASQSNALNALSKEAAARLYRDLNWELSEEWLRHQSRGTDILLEVSGADVGGNITEIKSDLAANLRGLRSISVDSASPGSATLSLVYVGWPEQLYDELSAAVDKGLQTPLALEGINGNTLQLRLVNAER